jgi:hypothetical protein
LPTGREPYGDRASIGVCGREQVTVYTGTEESKQPNGEVRQVSHGRDAKVREMRTADTILNIIQDRGKRQMMTSIIIGQSQRDKETREPDDAISITSGSEEAVIRSPETWSDPRGWEPKVP